MSRTGPLDPQALVSMADATSHRDVSAGGVVAAQDDTPKEVTTTWKGCTSFHYDFYTRNSFRQLLETAVLISGPLIF